MSDIKDFCPLWGEWELDGELGHGSFGTVWKVKRNDIGGKVYYAAVKHIPIPQDESEIDRLISEGIFSDSGSAVYYYSHRLQSVRDEIDAMYKLRGYTNIVSYEDHKIIEKPGGIGYDLFLRMELLTPLIERIKQGMNVDDVVSLGKDIAAAIKVLSDHQMIHRDIKPQNIFVNDHGDYKLGDYGTARALSTEATAMSRKGTYNYMSPEIYNNEKADIRADIYSLGIVLYRLLNGDKLPFLPYNKKITSEDSDNAVLVRMKGEVPIPPPRYADSELSAIVLKACAFKPEDRYGSAEEMIRDLERYQNKENKRIPGTDPDKTVTDTHGYTFDTPPWKNRTGTNEAGNDDENDDATVGDDNKHNREKETPVPHTPTLPPESTSPSKRKWIIPLAVVLLIGVLIGALRLAGIIGSDKPSERVSMMSGTDDPQTETPIVTVTDVITAEPIVTSSELVTALSTEIMTEATNSLLNETPITEQSPAVTIVPSTDSVTEVLTPTPVSTDTPTAEPTNSPSLAPTATPHPMEAMNFEQRNAYMQGLLKERALEWPRTQLELTFITVLIPELSGYLYVCTPTPVPTDTLTAAPTNSPSPAPTETPTPTPHPMEAMNFEQRNTYMQAFLKDRALEWPTTEEELSSITAQIPELAGYLYACTPTPVPTNTPSVVPTNSPSPAQTATPHPMEAMSFEQRKAYMQGLLKDRALEWPTTEEELSSITAQIPELTGYLYVCIPTPVPTNTPTTVPANTPSPAPTGTPMPTATLSPIPTTAAPVYDENAIRDMVFTKTQGGVALRRYKGASESVAIPETYEGDAVVRLEKQAFFNNSKIISVHIPSTVRTIDWGCFARSAKLESVEFDEGVNYIADNAFQDCISLKDVLLPDSLRSIGDYAFSNCTELQTVWIGSSVSFIGDHAFEGCSNMTILCEKDSDAEKYADEHGIPYQIQELQR